MAMGNELVFVLDPDSLIGVLDEDVRAHMEADTDPEDLRYELIGEVDGCCSRSFTLSIGRCSRPGSDPSPPSTTGTSRPQHPRGPRRFSHFRVAEYGLENAEVPAVGISIWGRYWPVWADGRHERGGSGWNIPVDAELLEMAGQARQRWRQSCPRWNRRR
ncbi:hypothetical protein [Terracoccus luteus]|uniref:Uncharacterized protein n=1 Tax=Terracoccus luteus TaxID=53356 RepID=A0A839PW28_9MICO|nr:hypothetical protein [Terracoccus luteus]MBB2988448.1 hypothetical protein [Terracoccus luteus]MCP2174097.1 hypothetical protein [Terracoccus luteus]